MVDDFENVELTPSEIEAAMYAAKKAKYYAAKNREYAARLRDEAAPLKLNSETMVKYLKGKSEYLRAEWNIDEFNEGIVHKLCRYFTGDEKSELDLSKGLLVFGNVGCGKTTLMKLFSENQRCSFRTVACKSIADKFLKAGNSADDVINEYSRLYSNSLFGREFKNGDSMGICFDDLGTEDEVKNFGNQRNVMADVILRCYDNHTLKGNVHITTNITTEQIKSFYGDRVYSRMQEMFNVIEFPVNTPDYRKTKRP